MTLFYFIKNTENIENGPNARAHKWLLLWRAGSKSKEKIPRAPKARAKNFAESDYFLGPFYPENARFSWSAGFAPPGSGKQAGASFEEAIIPPPPLDSNLGGKSSPLAQILGGKSAPRPP